MATTKKLRACCRQKKSKFITCITNNNTHFIWPLLTNCIPLQTKTAHSVLITKNILARILDPFDCGVKEEVKAPVDGTIFFVTTSPLVLEHTLIYRLRED